MTKIYRESFLYFLASFPALLVFAALIEVSLWVLQPKFESTISFIALIMMAYFFHRHFLFDETLSFRNQKPGPGTPPMKFGWFMLISAGLIFVPVALGLGLAFSYVDRPRPGAIILIFLPIYLVTLSLFGTALPATVARDGSYRLTQGLRTTLATMWRLILGPGVIGAVLIVATVFAGQALGALAVPERSLILLGYYILIRTLGFLTTIFAVAVLCEMYRLTRPATPL